MEKKLKAQRNRLFLRVTLVLLTVWLIVSATFCLILYYNRKSDAQNTAVSELSYAKQVLCMSELDTSTSSNVYISTTNLLYFKDLAGQNTGTQLRVIDPDSNRVIADTAYNLEVRYTLATKAGTYPDATGYINYNTVRDSLSDSQYGRIAGWLGRKADNGMSYGLAVTKFCFHLDEIIPLELSVLLTDDPEGRFDEKSIVERFDLGRAAEGETVYCNSDVRANAIPKDFMLSGEYNGNFIGLLSDEELEKSLSVKSLGGGSQIIYTSEYYYLDAFVMSEETGNFYSNPKLYLLQYANKADLLADCLPELITGVAVIFAFFFIIGLILCLMIWSIIRMQIIQEQKRMDFTNALAHDIKTPLFVISGYAYSLKEDIDSGERDIYIDKIISQTDQINAMVHRMLNLSKLDSYAVTLNRSDFDLCELTEEILSDYKSLPDEKSISFTHTGDSSINADRELIRSALQNLTENAVRYSPTGSRLTVSVNGRMITISNPSEPLTRSELKKIWQPYFRMDKSRHRKGNGLGLSIVKSILDLHGVKYDMSMKDGSMVFRADF